jgi:predicted enzyme related to lactoylglutathione lyase
MTTKAGRFVWHELATTDVNKSGAFYAELFGWKATEESMGPTTYTILKNGETQVGGITALTPAEHTPPHWRMYCSVTDVDAAAKKAAELGGKVVLPPTDIPTIGRFAVVVDPQGAVLLPFLPSQPADAMPELEGPPPVGTFCWDELLTTDPAKAADFYKAIYGWTISEQDMGGMTYRVLKRGERMAGGIMKLPMPGIPPHWGTYVAVAKVEETVKRVESLKAKVVVPPSDIPGMGRFATFTDPLGATLSVFQGK